MPRIAHQLICALPQLAPAARNGQSGAAVTTAKESSMPMSSGLSHVAMSIERGCWSSTDDCSVGTR